MTLEEEIEAALGWLVQGRAAGSDLEHDAREAVRAVLQRHGLRPRRLEATASPRDGLTVRVELPEVPPLVRAVRLRLR